MFKKSKQLHSVGLALSGGGTKGVAHIGVFRALLEENIPIFCVAGTSAGSILGAAFCAGMTCDKMEEIAKNITRREILNKHWLVGSDSQNIAKLARKFLGETTFEQLSIPFAAVAVDLSSGDEVILNSGEVASAVAASSSVPILFKPMSLDGRLLVDGGLLNNMPADVCLKMGADIVVGVDLNYARGKGTDSTKIWDTAVATWNITTKNAMLRGQMNSDIVIAPELGAYKNTRLDNIPEMIQAGYDAAREQIPQIKELMNTKY